MFGINKQSCDEFRIGRAYWANPCIRGAGREIVVPIARDAGVITFALVDDLTSGRVDRTELSGEFARMGLGDMDYTVSARMLVPAEDAAEVLAVVRSRRRA